MVGCSGYQQRQQQQQQGLQSNSGMHRYECVALCKDVSLPERPILRQISSLMYPKIQRRPVIMNVIHPSWAWLPRWSPPVLWRRFEGGLASIGLLIHLWKMPKESETTGLDDGRKWWLVGNAEESCHRTWPQKISICSNPVRFPSFINNTSSAAVTVQL